MSAARPMFLANPSTWTRRSWTRMTSHSSQTAQGSSRPRTRTPAAQPATAACLRAHLLRARTPAAISVLRHRSFQQQRSAQRWLSAAVFAARGLQRRCRARRHSHTQGQRFVAGWHQHLEPGRCGRLSETSRRAALLQTALLTLRSRALLSTCRRATLLQATPLSLRSRHLLPTCSPRQQPCPQPLRSARRRGRTQCPSFVAFSQPHLQPVRCGRLSEPSGRATLLQATPLELRSQDLGSTWRQRLATCR